MLTIRITIPSRPNSVPPRGRKANTPPIPNVLNNPKAQEGQAGARMATIIPGRPREAFIVNWRRRRKRLIEKTMPPKSDIKLRRTSAEMVRLLIDPVMSEKSREIEN
ncbi:hypothetical protein HYU22_05325 [Candidatus Woesearchaeota archaeon]|nr:hypothetical protein [Candidatus Woesearchaeota archaeon]